MRVLLFTTTPCKYYTSSLSFGYNGGGWMISLQTHLEALDDVSLGICFMMDGEPSHVRQDGVDYYPVPNPSKPIREKIRGFIRWKDVTVDKYSWSYYIDKFRNVICEFKPDVIHIFGSELYMGLASFASDIPCVLHIQGVINPCKDVLFPPGMSIRDYMFSDMNLLHIVQRYFCNLWWERSCYREREILKNIKHVIGRTDWDERVSYMLNNKRIYHFGEEIMREPFYHPLKRTLPKKLTINSIISRPSYKGYDIILKTAFCLKTYLDLDFDWNVYGNVDPNYIQKSLHISAADVNVHLKGVVNAEEIVKIHSCSTLYVHPSYIENGCNAIIEAQMCGCTPIANYVGGLSNTVINKETGFLVPANDAYQLAYLIKYLYDNPKLNLEIGKNASEDAFERHDPKRIILSLLQTYKDVINAG